MIPLDKIVPYKADRIVESPNHGVRRAKMLAGVVIHATADGGNEAGSVEWMRNPKSQASAHLLIHRDGSVTRLVDDRRRAWHAGVASWRGSTDVNSVALGWELANRNDGREEYTPEQYARLAEIAAHYVAQGLTLADFVGHSEIAPGRKTDPGPRFDWDRFRADVGRLTDPAWPAPGVYSPPVPPPDHTADLDLERIVVPHAGHVAEILRVRRLSPDVAEAGLIVAEVLLRGIVGGRKAGVKAAADALADWLKGRAA